MSTTKEEKLATGWSREFPSLKYGSWFWMRDRPDAEPHLRQITGGRSWLEAFGMVCDTTEFLGPVTSADAEQLARLREAAGSALAFVEDGGESCHNAYHVGESAAQRFRDCQERSCQQVRQLTKELRSALTNEKG